MSGPGQPSRLTERRTRGEGPGLRFPEPWPGPWNDPETARGERLPRRGRRAEARPAGSSSDPRGPVRGAQREREGTQRLTGLPAGKRRRSGKTRAGGLSWAFCVRWRTDDLPEGCFTSTWSRRGGDRRGGGRVCEGAAEAAVRRGLRRPRVALAVPGTAAVRRSGRRLVGIAYRRDQGPSIPHDATGSRSAVHLVPNRPTCANWTNGVDGGCGARPVCWSSPVPRDSSSPDRSPSMNGL